MPSPLLRWYTALACAALLTVLGGCGVSDEEKVRDTVDEFVHARNEGDYEKVCDLFDDKFRRDQGLIANCAQTLQAQATGQPAQGDAETVSVKVKGGKATAELDASQGGEAPSRLTITLVRRDGEWKIASTT